MFTIQLYKIKFRLRSVEFKVVRRYSNFEALRELLLEFYPFDFVPPIPIKQIMKNQIYIVDRIQNLRKFLVNLFEEGSKFWLQPLKDFFDPEIDHS